MSVGKSVIVAMGISFLLGLVGIGCSGDKGPDGPSGFVGPQGPPGLNNQIPVFADREFGIMLTNGTELDYQGALRVTLTSDSTKTPTNTTVVARYLNRAPVVDGVDGGVGEWGVASQANISIGRVAGSDLGIATAAMRVGYDRKYVYMQVSWTEVANGSFVASADVTKNMWKQAVVGTDTTWSQSGGEDKLYLMWERTVGGISNWSSQGALSIFDGSNFRTSVNGELADLWIWQSTETNYSGCLADKSVQFAESGDGSSLDTGASSVLENSPNDGYPKYMKSGSRTVGSSYPLRSFEYAKFAKFLKPLAWRNGATIPGYITFTPSGSAADVEAIGVFSNGTWTVELRRLRETGNVDDAVL